MKYATLILSLLICELAGVLGFFLMGNGVISWYPNLVKPLLTPPAYVFAPVWTVLYALMGIALYEFIEGAENDVGYAAFAAQLILNVLWSLLFFGQHMLLAGLIDLIAIVIATIITVIFFYESSEVSAYLLLPYLAWLIFATYLNLGLVILNMGFASVL